MKLYYSPGVCSLSPHICLREAGLEFELVKVDIGKHLFADGADFRQVNPNGYVPVLELDSGERLTEGPAIVQYIADQKPESGLAPANGSIERTRLQSWLNFLSTEIHKGYGPLFNPAANEEFKAVARQRLCERYNWVQGRLGRKAFLMGDEFSCADAYLFTTLNWMKFVGLDLGDWPELKSYSERVAARPKVQEALKAEGLVK